MLHNSTVNTLYSLIHDRLLTSIPIKPQVTPNFLTQIQLIRVIGCRTQSSNLPLLLKDVLSEQNWPNDKTDKCPQFFSALTIKLNPSKSQKYRIKISIEPTFSGHSIFEGFSESG